MDWAAVEKPAGDHAACALWACLWSIACRAGVGTAASPLLPKTPPHPPLSRLAVGQVGYGLRCCLHESDSKA